MPIALIMETGVELFYGTVKKNMAFLTASCLWDMQISEEEGYPFLWKMVSGFHSLLFVSVSFMETQHPTKAMMFPYIYWKEFLFYILSLQQLKRIFII